MDTAPTFFKKRWEFLYSSKREKAPRKSNLLYAYRQKKGSRFALSPTARQLCLKPSNVCCFAI